MQELLIEFPVVIQIPVAWGEMDAFQHVNNIVYFRYFESARIAYLERMGFLEIMEQTGVGPILAATNCRFRKALTYPDTLSVGARVAEIGADRLTMRYRVVSHKLQAVAAEGEGTLVAYDYQAGRKTTLPDAIRQRIESIEGSSFRQGLQSLEQDFQN